MDDNDTEVDCFHLAQDVPSKFKADGKSPRRVDVWWAEVLSTHDFTHLGCVVIAAQSIFTGPRIEQSFSGMNNIITGTTNRLHIDTFAAIQTVKFHLLESKQKSVNRYPCHNYLHSSVNPKTRKEKLTNTRRCLFSPLQKKEKTFHP